MNKSVGARVKRLRLEKEWSQATLATKAGVTPNTIRGLEKHSLNTRWPKIQKIAKALGTTPEALLQAEDVTPADPMLVGLNREDLEIARAHHDAPTTIRQRVTSMLKNPEPETLPESIDARAKELADRLIRLGDQRLALVENMIVHLETHGAHAAGVKRNDTDGLVKP